VEILKIAEKHGVEQNFFFITTFKLVISLFHQRGAVALLKASAAAPLSKMEH
jgi:hypothetical protein